MEFPTVKCIGGATIDIVLCAIHCTHHTEYVTDSSVWSIINIIRMIAKLHWRMFLVRTSPILERTDKRCFDHCTICCKLSIDP